jgi:hypothetical protein
MASTFTLTLDTTAPAGAGLLINSDATYTTSRAVSANLATTDPSTVGYQVKLWGDVDPAADGNVQTTEAASAWVTYSTSKAVTLATGDGLKTLNARIRDDVGNQTAVLTDAITLDTTVPVVTITAAASPTRISKTTGFDTSTFSFQADTAIVAWKVKAVPSVNSLENAGTTIGTSNGSLNTTGAALAATTNQSVTVKGADLEAASAGDGAKIVKVFAQDAAGNWSV